MPDGSVRIVKNGFHYNLIPPRPFPEIRQRDYEPVDDILADTLKKQKRLEDKATQYE